MDIENFGFKSGFWLGVESNENYTDMTLEESSNS